MRKRRLFALLAAVLVAGCSVPVEEGSAPPPLPPAHRRPSLPRPQSPTRPRKGRFREKDSTPMSRRWWRSGYRLFCSPA